MLNSNSNSRTREKVKFYILVDWSSLFKAGELLHAAVAGGRLKVKGGKGGQLHLSTSFPKQPTF